MKKMHSGFTLVELLAVIIILSLLVLITGTAVTKITKDSKKNLYNTQIALIKDAAESWSADNLLSLPENGECIYISLRTLKDYGLLDEDLVNPITNEQFSDDLNIKITSSLNKYNSIILKYEIDAQDISKCTSISIAALNENE